MYGIGQWYIKKHQNEPLVFGTTFIASYAEYLDLSPKETLNAMLNELGVKRIRLVSYWNEIEPHVGRYDFSNLDWQFDMIEKAGGTVTLSIGLRQPRWPECHLPEWAEGLPKRLWEPRLKMFMAEVVERYRDRDVLESYQLENEYLLEVFGECPDFSRQRLIDEHKLVKALDSTRPVLISRSNNAVPSWPVGKPRADMNGAAIYKRVWDRTLTKRYFEYPLPAWYYAFLAGGAELTTGVNTFVHELQTEPWVPDGMGGIKEISIEEQNKSFGPRHVESRIQYAVNTGMRTIDLWGVEWWYWRKVVKDDPSIWNTAKEVIQEHSTTP